MHNVIEENSEDTKGVTKNRKPTKNRQLTFDTTIAIMNLRIVCVTNDHGCVPLVVITIRSFPHS
jgi:hypothetical protein